MTMIRQYIAWTEQKIATLMIREGLHVGCLGVIQGPLTITFRLRLLQPSRQALMKLLSLGPALATIIQVEGVRVSQSSDSILVELPSPIKRTPTAAFLATYTQALAVCVGLNSMRQPVSIDLTQHGAVFWVGPSRRGKTQSMRSTLYALAHHNGRLKFVILCHERKWEDWQSFAEASACMGIVADPKEHKAVLQWAAGPLLQMRTPFIFVIVVDDLLNLLQRAPELADSLAEIASMGAGLGVHLLAGTQEAGSKRGTGGEGVEANTSAKVLYKATSKARAARNAGQGEIDLAALTSAKGDAVLLVDGFQQRIATGYADDALILQLPQGPGWQAPWREERGTQHSVTSSRTGTAASSVLANSRGTTPVPVTLPSSDHPVQTGHGQGVDEGGTPGTDERKLPNCEPNAEDRIYLRALLARYGSKNKVLAIAWGGIVNESGKTPKTLTWLNDALAESGSIPQEKSVVLSSQGKALIDMNTAEGRAALDLLIAHGILPVGDSPEVVRYQ